jgi:LDH2 family malate/lactate/ureidoglycolate dehydrogenase
VAADAGEQIPEGWVVDAEGNPVTDPAKADEGFLVPMGGYKGAGLNIAIGLLAGVINGAAFGSSVVDQLANPSTPTNTGQVILALRADLFAPHDETLAAVEAGLDELRSGISSGGPLRLPGDESNARQADQQRSGVTLSDLLVRRLDALGQRLGLSDRVASS